MSSRSVGCNSGRVRLTSWLPLWLWAETWLGLGSSTLVMGCTRLTSMCFNYSFMRRRRAKGPRIAGVSCSNSPADGESDAPGLSPAVDDVAGPLQRVVRGVGAAGDGLLQLFVTPAALQRLPGAAHSRFEIR